MACLLDVCLYAQMAHMDSTAMRAANARMMPYALILMDLAPALLAGKGNIVIRFVPRVSMERNAQKDANA